MLLNTCQWLPIALKKTILYCPSGPACIGPAYLSSLVSNSPSHSEWQPTDFSQFLQQIMFSPTSGLSLMLLPLSEHPSYNPQPSNFF